MKGLISIDTMYLNIRYPKANVFQAWYKYAEGITFRKLKEGILVNGFVVRNGTQGYKVSVWQHDARVYLTDQVDEKIGDGNGMGVWVQLGPKFLIQHADNLQSSVNELIQEIGILGYWPIRITRLDLALDLLGVAMVDQDLNLWRNGWVGRSKISSVYFNSRTGDLETINVGSRESAVFLRVYDKISQAIKEGDIAYWYDVWKEFNGPVTRIEWEVKPTKGEFTSLKDFLSLNSLSVIELLNYLLDWGRLCVPDENDNNNSRWHDAKIWQQIRELSKEWADGVDWPTSRKGKEFHGISEKYVKFLSGTIAGGMARFGEKTPTMMNLLEGLADHGECLDAINKRAAAKAAIYSKL